jgi:hypothetical protein
MNQKEETSADSSARLAAKASLLAPIARDEVYPLPIFRQRTGLSAWAMRSARRAGLRVVPVGKRFFVTGQDWFEFVTKTGGESRQAD